MNKTIQLLILFCAIITTSIHAQSPVAHYNFFRDTVDISGLGNDLTYSNSATSLQTYDNCRRYMDFVTDGYLNKDNPNLSLTNAVTVAFWMRSGDITTDQKVVGQATPGSRGFVIGPENDVIKAEIFGSQTQVLLSDSIQKNTWIHIALVFESNSRYELYIDGVLDITLMPAYAWMAPTTESLVLGGAPWDADELSYTGDHDDVIIYNTALSAAQIDSIYNSHGLSLQLANLSM